MARFLFKKGSRALLLPLILMVVPAFAQKQPAAREPSSVAWKSPAEGTAEGHAAPVAVAAAVGVGGAATTPTLAVEPLTCPVTAEIQQLPDPFWTTHHVLSALRPVMLR